MPWDFETEPEFEEKLAWMRAFIDGELIPLEPIFDELPADEWRVVKRHLQDQVKAEGLWGAFLDPKLGGQGLGQLKLALMSEIIGRCMMSMTIFGVQAPDSGNMELLAHGATDAQKERWLWPNLRGEISSAFALTEPFLAGADPTVIGTTAIEGRRRVGDRRPQVVHHERVGRRHRAGVRRDQPRGPPAPARVDVRRARPGRRAWRSCVTSARWRTPTSSSGARATTPRSSSDDCRVPADHLIGAARRGVRARAAAARRRSHPPRDALARPGAAVARHHVRTRGLPHVARQAARAAPDGPGLRRAVAHGDPVGAAAHVPDRVEDGQVRRGAQCAPTSA